MPTRRADVCVLDTHVWIWWASEDLDRIGRKAKRFLAGTDVALVPSICQWEVAQLVADGKIALHHPVDEWIAQAIAHPGVQVVEISPRIAAGAVDLRNEGFHRDPADRLIYATARDRDAALLTMDERIRAFEQGLGRNVSRLTIWD
ncbi:MAG: type II toxin-antitoxin system VapC family toxin [Actinobacteria bacterium]|nr:type II toxin-antitoxin system VapC family toxin [Actinomycetota bacterium]